MAVSAIFATFSESDATIPMHAFVWSGCKKGERWRLETGTKGHVSHRRHAHEIGSRRSPLAQSHVRNRLCVRLMSAAAGGTPGKRAL